jgi:F420H(2)-dependent quinone reductase
MKVFWKILGGLAVCLVVLLLVFRIIGLEPHDTIPGLWLKGNVVTAPVTNWTWTDQVPTIKLQTESWYLLPHSVTIDCMTLNGRFYVSSGYPPQSPKTWYENVMRDPHVRIQIGHNLYDRTLTEVKDPTEAAAAMKAKYTKYPTLKTPSNFVIHVFRVDG